MKVCEILQPQIMNEDVLAARLKGFDWKYEFSEDVRRQMRGHKAMAELELMMFEFWKKNPDRAIQLWAKHSPYGREGVTPSFIIRMESQGL